MGNAQDDPGLFVTAIASNITDQRYLPFENAGAISSWHLEMPQIEQRGRPLDRRRRDAPPLLHRPRRRRRFQQAVQANNAANLPTSGIKVFSAQNDFAAPSPTAANPYPVSPWQAFLGLSSA